jgi:adenylate kinase family enzyme
MHKIVIFGNSGSGKSTLAKAYVASYCLAHLDLDTLAWEDTLPPVRKDIKQRFRLIDQFQLENENWVIEGCYSDLLEYALINATEAIFLNPGVKQKALGTAQV